MEPIIVFNACDKDSQMQMKCFDWMQELDGKLNYDCIIAQDQTMNQLIARQFMDKAVQTFAGVSHFIYERPAVIGWPQAPNWVFQTVARMVNEEVGRPWFWMEADMIPLGPRWIEKLFAEYARCGKPLMGSQLPGRGHLNGTAIYPSNFCEIAPHAMNAINIAWDWEMVLDTRDIQHDASHLMQHVWGITNGKPDLFAGETAVFRTIQDVRNWVSPLAVTFHRSKDGTLIDRLREIRNPAPEVESVNGGGGCLKL